MKICKKCGKELVDSATFCGECGAKAIPSNKWVWVLVIVASLTLISLLNVVSGAIQIFLVSTILILDVRELKSLYCRFVEWWKVLGIYICSSLLVPLLWWFSIFSFFALLTYLILRAMKTKTKISYIIILIYAILGLPNILALHMSMRPFIVVNTGG